MQTLQELLINVDIGTCVCYYMKPQRADNESEVFEANVTVSQKAASTVVGTVCECVQD